MRKTYCAAVNVPYVSLWLLLFFLSSVRNYFGEKVALYYLWLGWYTYLLIPPAVIGAIVFLYGLAFFNSSPLMWASLRPLCICAIAAMAVHSALCCVPERRCATQTRSCARSVTGGVKCGSYLTPARMPRYICAHMIVGSIFQFVCPHLRLFVSAGEPAVR